MSCLQRKGIEMLKITRYTEGNKVNIVLEGRLDSVTSPDLEKELVSVMSGGITSVTFDFAKLDYITSAGLRLLLSLQQNLEDNGELKLLHVNKDIMEIFEMTGFSEILTIA